MTQEAIRSCIGQGVSTELGLADGEARVRVPVDIALDRDSGEVLTLDSVASEDIIKVTLANEIVFWTNVCCSQAGAKERGFLLHPIPASSRRQTATLLVPESSKRLNWNQTRD